MKIHLKLSTVVTLLLLAFAVHATAQVPGTYVATVVDISPSVSPLGGKVKVVISPSLAVSGTLTLGTAAHNFSAPNSANPIPVPGAGIYLNLTYNAAPDIAYGIIKDSFGTNAGSFDAFPITPNPAPFVGNYTFCMGISPGSPEDGDLTVPQGYSYGSFKVAANGIATGIIKMADDSTTGGATFTFSTPVSGTINGLIPIYRTLYGNKGHVSGILVIDTLSGNRLDISLMEWKKQFVGGSTTNYRSGFGPIQLAVNGSRRPGTGSAMPMNLPAGSGNAQVQLSSGLAPTARMDVASVTIGPSTPTGATGTFPAPYNSGPVLNGAARYSAFNFKPQFGTLFTAGTTDVAKGTITLKDTNPMPTPTVVTRTCNFRGIIVDDGTGTEKTYGYFMLKALPSPLYPTAAVTPYLSGRIIIQP
jgi:hypothetical protein